MITVCPFAEGLALQLSDLKNFLFIVSLRFCFQNFPESF